MAVIIENFVSVLVISVILSLDLLWRIAKDL
jgi:hypothetical protein